ncbi:MAG: hypothetical protein ACLT2Z_04450 [Eubacterium sp.]
MGKRISVFLCTVLMFMLLVVAKPQGVGAQKTGGQGKGDCYGVDIFTDAATENITKKLMKPRRLSYKSICRYHKNYKSENKKANSKNKAESC